MHWESMKMNQTVQQVFPLGKRPFQFHLLFMPLKTLSEYLWAKLRPSCLFCSRMADLPGDCEMMAGHIFKMERVFFLILFCQLKHGTGIWGSPTPQIHAESKKRARGVQCFVPPKVFPQINLFRQFCAIYSREKNSDAAYQIKTWIIEHCCLKSSIFKKSNQSIKT